MYSRDALDGTAGGVLQSPVDEFNATQAECGIDSDTQIGAQERRTDPYDAGTDCHPEQPAKDVNDPAPVKRTRGRPKGSTAKGKGRSKRTTEKEFITTDVVRSNNPSIPGSSTVHRYDVVRVTISPLENPSVLPYHRTQDDVPAASMAGTSAQSPQLHGTQPDVSQSKTLPLLTNIAEMVRTLSDDVQHAAHDVDVKARVLHV